MIILIIIFTVIMIIISIMIITYIIMIIRPGDQKLLLRAADLRPGKNLRADKVSF